MARYATGTTVSAERSEVEIKRTLTRYGADDVVTGQSARKRQAFVQFQYKGLPIEIRISLPDINAKEFQETPSGRRKRDAVQANMAWTKACKQQWRVLLLMIKANLEAVENEVLPATEVFLPWLLLPTGETLAKALESKIANVLESGETMKLLTFEKKG